MSFQVDYEERTGYLYVHVVGERSLEAVIALAREVFEKAVELRYQRLLIDVRDFGGELRTMESYELVNREFPKYTGKGLKQAAILDRERPDPREWNFLETLPRNRGFNLKIHTDPERAIVWLLEGPDSAAADK